MTTTATTTSTTATARPALRHAPLGDLTLVSGEVLLGVQVAHRIHGDLAAGRPVVVLPTYYTGSTTSYDPWIGPGRPLDPARCTVVVVGHLGGGESTSPSTTPATARFPRLDVRDTVAATELLLDHLGVDRVALVAGWSLAGVQALELAARWGERVDAVLALCSAARCSPANRLFLESVGAVLASDGRVVDSHPTDPTHPSPARPEGRDAFGRAYCGWAWSEAFLDDELYRELGYDDVTDLVAAWGRDHTAHDADDLLVTLRMWHAADLGRGRGGLAPALASITARTLLVPGTTDRYFTLAENKREAAHLPRGELRPLDSPLGHVAGRPGVRAAEQDLVDHALRTLLGTPAPSREKETSR
ncbi:alpha/beta fold hydrolase [Litorihabitans aurantiacus]|uniref:Homoserine O-acetyltransferase n=1 Tax=Litorihabitans aurantiacus TaxID=1930061 RepID=A0AA38CVE6_9MICO|nr:alpha/beta fold hydrolase [Litorihabitans aurantiacus]GMA32830.1 homoserine O-acetyltransferase [Litorihabitans aurantiacus]